MNKIISPDHFLFEDGKYVWTPQRVKEAWAKAHHELKLSLAMDDVKNLMLVCGIPASGKSSWLLKQPEDPQTVFFDATLTNKKTRKQLIKIAETAKANVSIAVFNTDFDTCVSRNNARSEDRKVPQTILERMHRHFEKGPPDMSEGYACMFFVT